MHAHQRQFDRTPQQGGASGQKITKVFKRIIWVASFLFAVSVVPMGAAHGPKLAKHPKLDKPAKHDKLDTKLRHRKTTDAAEKISVIIRATEAEQFTLVRMPI